MERGIPPRLALIVAAPLALAVCALLPLPGLAQNAAEADPPPATAEEAAADATEQAAAEAWKAQGITTINGSLIRTGAVESNDGNTKFDLENQRLVMTDSS